MSKTSPEYNTSCLLYVGIPTPSLLRRISEIPEGTNPYGKYVNWAFTVTVNPKNHCEVPKHYAKSGVKRFEDCLPSIQYAYLKEHLFKCVTEAIHDSGPTAMMLEKFDCYFELTQNGHLHAHGVMKVKFATQIVLQVFGRYLEAMIGRSQVEYMHTNSEWLNYCLKAQDDTQCLLFPPLHWDKSILNVNYYYNIRKECKKEVQQLVRKVKTKKIIITKLISPDIDINV